MKKREKTEKENEQSVGVTRLTAALSACMPHITF
jgi:hypothetical protein